jgi:hypothetical protein
MWKRLRGSGPASWWLDSLLAFILAAVLIWPLFKLKYADNWASIEATFIADARFLAENWPHPLWQPLWYTGTRFDYIYPPALRYGTAALVKYYPNMTAARAYHLYTAFFYCLGMAGVYLLARRGSGSRGFALFAAAAVATISPSFLFLTDIRKDALAGWSEPHRLSALVRYGEGPHITAVACIGFTLAFSMAALASGRRRYVALAAVSAAMTVSNNFYGGTALVFFFPVLVWAYWITHQDKRVFSRAAAIGLLAYGLTAFWLVPAYLRVTYANMRFVSERGNRWSFWVTLVLLIAYLKITERWAKGKKELVYPVFLAGALAIFTLNVIGNYYLQYRIIGEPLRMVPEFDLVIILLLAELFHRVWMGGTNPRRIAAVALAVICLAFGARYIKHAWKPYVPYPDHTQRVEYQITEWLAKNMQDARFFATGSLRFWFNAWFDLAQGGGGSEQGLLNPVVQPLAWRIMGEPNPEDGIAWMNSMGIDAVIVHDKESEEIYHDIQHPKKFDGLLPVVFDDGKGNRVYRNPRRYPGLARVVDTARLNALPIPPEEAPLDHLKQLAALLEQGPDTPTQTKWEGTDRLKIQARVAEGQSVFVQVAHDRPWHAYSNGQPLAVHRSQLNFMRIDAPPGDHTIDLVFELPMQNIIGRVLTAATLILIILLIAKREKTV